MSAYHRLLYATIKNPKDKIRMCNIAGYVGELNAAPILIEMLRREEGIDAGFYTGIATLHEGKIHYRKVLGDLDTLLSTTDAASLPGRVGIIHSRTRSGGPQSWSHPFVSGGKNSPEPKVAYVANGNSGIFGIRNPEFNRLADGLVAEGYKLDTEADFDGEDFNHLSNGIKVHMSDIMCGLIAREIDRGGGAAKAMENAFCTMPGDIVGLLLSLESEDRIFWSKISRPMNLAFASHGAYLATTTIAFPEDEKLTAPVKLPTLAGGYVTKDSYSAKRYENPPADVVSADLSVMAKVYADVEKKLSKGGSYHINEINVVSRKYLPRLSDKLSTFTQASYEALEALYREGAEKANYVARKTLSKAMKKVGFVL